MLILQIAQFWICLFLLFGASSSYAVTTLDHAKVTLEISGTEATPRIADAVLPYQWDQLHGAVDGRAHFSFSFFSSDPASPQAIFIPRIGNTFDLVLNGVVIGKMGTKGNRYQDFAKQPHFFRIPNGVLRTQNTLDITIDVQGGRNGGLSAVMLGPEDDVRTAYTSSYRWRVTGSLVVAVISAVLGAIALLLWLRQRERLYLYYASSELLWVVYISDALVQHSPLPWPWWGVIYFSAYAMSAVLIFKFALQVMNLHKGALKIASDWNLFLTLPVVLIGILGAMPWMERAWKITTDLVSICIIVTIVRHGLFNKELEKRVLTIGILIVVIAGIHDDFALVVLPYTKMFSGYDNQFGIVIWMRFAWCVFGISLAWIIAERMRASAQEIANTNQTLLQRLAQREAELNIAFVKQTSVERHQSMLEERQRITRDMHDGLGAQLLSTMHMAQDPAVSKETLNMQLRDTLDHLKLTVDAMQDTEGDIGTLLGSIRYRLGPRLAAAGICLTWSVGSLPAITRWSLQNSRDLQMILFEAFSNMIAHAAASNAQLRAEYDLNSDTIHILLQDDGCGFDTHRAAFSKGNGLLNMRTRAASLCAEFAISSMAPALSTLEPASAGTRIELTIACNDLAPQAS